MRVEGYKRVFSKNTESLRGCGENATRSKGTMSGGCVMADNFGGWQITLQLAFSQLVLSLRIFFFKTLYVTGT